MICSTLVCRYFALNTAKQYNKSDGKVFVKGETKRLEDHTNKLFGSEQYKAALSENVHFLFLLFFKKELKIIIFN